MKPIEVTMSRKEIELGNEVLNNLLVMARLREAGIPVLGRISLQGVEHGTFEMIEDRTFGDVVYRWTPDPDYDPAEGL